MNDGVVREYTALSALVSLCHDMGIKCFNAECRQAGVAYKKQAIDLETLSAEVELLVDEVKGYDSPLVDYYDQALSSFLSIQGKKTVQELYEVGLELIEIRMVHHLYDLFKNGYTGDVFIFER